MFMAARERAPELKQWIVNGDTAVERGGLVAESVSGSVDSRREHFRDLVDGILSHLALPVREDEEKDAPAVHELVEREVRRIATLAPEPDHSPEAASDAASEIIPEPEAVPAVDTASESDFEPDLPQEAAVPGAIQPPTPVPAAPSAPEPGAASISAEESEPGRAATPPTSVAPEPEDEISPAPPVQEVRPEPAPPMDAGVQPNVLAEDLPEDLPEAWLPPLGEEGPHIKAAPSAAARPEADTDGYEGTAAAAVFDAAPDTPDASAKENPSLAELEEELFPVENGDEREVLSNGGFLPGADGK